MTGMTGWNGPLLPVSLEGQNVKLVPLSMVHAPDLMDAVADGQLWEQWYTLIPESKNMAAEIERRLRLQEQGLMLPFAVVDQRDASATRGQAVGMTTFMNIDAMNRRLEIGATWYRQSVQRTAINTESKLLLLTYAFESLNCIAVEFRTHFFNQRSRRAIERLGAKLDGVLRNHQITQHPKAQGTLRDTCVYSVIASEWTCVKAHLMHRLGGGG